MLVACGPGPTASEPAPATPPRRVEPAPTKPVPVGPDCNMKAMARLTSTIADAGLRHDLDASVAVEEVQPSDATAVMQNLAPDLTGCNPEQLEGCAFITTTVAEDGRVTAAETFVSDGLPDDVLACLGSVLANARFAAVPKAGKMTVPVTFTRTR